MEYHCQNFTQFTYCYIVTNDLGVTLYQSCSNFIILQEMDIKSGASFFPVNKKENQELVIIFAGLLFHWSKGSKVFAINRNFPG